MSAEARVSSGAYAETFDDETLAQLIEAMLPIELASLGLAPR